MHDKFFVIDLFGPFSHDQFGHSRVGLPMYDTYHYFKFPVFMKKRIHDKDDISPMQSVSRFCKASEATEIPSSENRTVATPSFRLLGGECSVGTSSKGCSCSVTLLFRAPLC